jgi:putative ABC transport system substrate-binding protein
LLGEGQRIGQAKAFRRAKTSLGIQSIREGFGPGGEWAWELPRSSEGKASSASEIGPQPPRAEQRVPADWVEGIARLQYNRPPCDVPPHRWRQIVDDCNAFLNSPQAERAAQLGWRTMELFGCKPSYPLCQNVAIEYRWANDQYDRLAALANDLIRRQVSVIVANTPANLVSKASTDTIPIVFTTGGDPVQLGLVASLNRPGGNVTGVTQLTGEVASKRLELLHELIPSATVIALLTNPTDTAFAETVSRETETASRKLGVQLLVLQASSERDLDGVFAKLIELRAGGLVVSPGAFFSGHTEQLAALAMRHSVPVIFEFRKFVEAGGLASYGGSSKQSYRLAGGYVARILKGEKPADLPVQ